MELAEDAVALDAMVDEADAGQWHEWSHTATDGETVAFLRQIANDEVREVRFVIHDLYSSNAGRD